MEKFFFFLMTMLIAESSFSQSNASPLVIGRAFTDQTKEHIDEYNFLSVKNQDGSSSPYKGDAKSAIRQQVKSGMPDLTKYQVKGALLLPLDDWNYQEEPNEPIAYLFVKRDGYWMKVRSIPFHSEKVDSIYQIKEIVLKKISPQNNNNEDVVLSDILALRTVIIVAGQPQSNIFYYGIKHYRYDFVGANKFAF